MKILRFQFITSILILFIAFQAIGQRKCATVEYMNQLGNTETKDVLENWIRQKQLASPSSGLKSFNAEALTVYQIPVVVHIVHKGEEIGVGSNISDAQILSQIEAINEDFRKSNADSVNIPTVFKPLYSDIGFEFIMAKRDPLNGATNGITRTVGSQTTWNIDSGDDIELKSHDYWPSEDYLNIWVAPLCCNWLGWAQFPQSDVLSGLDPPYNATTDGVVITYNAFGSIAKDPSANLQADFNLGRTATHEIGHFFGLRHIWGDGGCGVDDYVNDTPSADDNYTACPSLGSQTTSCGSQDMFMNFMDYVYDDCMNIFSLGQKDRMLIIMENSPRRLSLTKSAGLFPPNSDDLALLGFIQPTNGICSNLITPVVLVKNVGISNICSISLSLYIDNNLVADQNFNIYINSNDSQELIFSAIKLTTFGNLSIRAEINTLNGFPDIFTENNTIEITSLRAETVTTLFEDFSSTNSQWTVRTNQEISALERSQSVFYSITNNSAAFNFYQSEPRSDSYISPKLILNSSHSTLFFDYAYAFREADDEFTITISTDCGNTFEDVLFTAKGEELSDLVSPVAFYPSGAQDWQHVQINLSAYENQEVIFAFMGNSKGGNRILFDNIRVEDKNYNDIALVGLKSPATNCGVKNEVLIEVENKGSQVLNNLILETTVNATISTISYPKLNLIAGERAVLTLPTPKFQGSTEITVSIANDDNNENNKFTQTIISASSIDAIPLREKFEGDTPPTNWNLVANKQNNNQGWQFNNNQIEFIAANSVAKGLTSSIVLPPLNLYELNSASMHFDFAYAYDGFNEELLKVKATKDCGLTYQTLFIQGGNELATSNATTPWVPNGASDWKNVYVDLSDFAGSENVQLVIEVISAQGNNAFVDNIELYASNIITPLELVKNTITVYPNPASNGTVNISFNLSNSQPAKLLIYDSQGSFVYDESIPNALNQTFEITTMQLPNGIYFARIVGNQTDISRSFVVNN